MVWYIIFVVDAETSTLVTDHIPVRALPSETSVGDRAFSYRAPLTLTLTQIQVAKRDRLFQKWTQNTSFCINLT